MQIDWFTFAAQIINFLILVALLKRFLYGPIIKAIAAREDEIAARYAEAEESRQAADTARAGFEHKTQQLEHAREDLLATAAADVDKWKTTHLAAIRTEVEQDRADWYVALDREREQLQSELRSTCGVNAVRLAQGLLECLSDNDGQELIVQAFVRRLNQLDDADRAMFRENVVVRSAHALTAAQRSAVQQALSEAVSDAGAVRFRTEPDLVCGLELKSGGHRLAWNGIEGLDFLQQQMSKEIEESLPDAITAGKHDH